MTTTETSAPKLPVAREPKKRKEITGEEHERDDMTQLEAQRLPMTRLNGHMSEANGGHCRI